MKIQFPKQPTDAIIAAIKKAMDGRSLNDLVSFESTKEELIVKISKMGTSVLTFQRQEKDDQAEFNLVSEKIAFAHKAFKDDVKLKLQQVIAKAGGKASEG
jgi:DNA polymerase sigma